MFTLSSSGQDGVSTMDILTQLASTCNFAISAKDAKSTLMLNTPVSPFSLKNVMFEDLLDILLSEKNLSYDYTGNLLKVSYYTTKTFKLNYISTSRESSSTTSVTISGDDTLGSGLTGGSNTGGSSTSGTGKTTTEIQSKDEYKFWSGIEEELKNIIFSTNDINSTNGDRKVIINKGAGLITVKGTADEVAAAEKYIKVVEKNVQTSVMIDVSILKVTLANSKSIGIDWGYFLNNVGINIAASGVFNKHSGGTLPNDITYPTNTDTGSSGAMPIQSVVGAAGAIDKNFGYSILSTSLTLGNIVNFLKTYGDVNSVSNPKVITLNNQPALISVGEIIRYKRTIVYQSTGTGGTTQNEEDVYPSIFAGILLDITPSIDNDNEIILKINPSITDTKGIDVDSASTALDAPPNLTTNQLSSIVRARGGEKIIIGGLIKRDKTNETKKVPLLGDIPILGYAFKREEAAIRSEELVIIITPHIVGQDGSNEISLKDLGYENIGKNGIMVHKDDENNTKKQNDSNTSKSMRGLVDGQI